MGARAVGHRRVSVASDEPLCIAAFFALNVGRVRSSSRELSKFVLCDIDLRPVWEKLRPMLGFAHGVDDIEKTTMHMEEVWRQIEERGPGIPQEVIFHKLDRLQSRGFRWAPATLQQAPQDAFNLFAEGLKFRPGKMSADGLSVKCSGFGIRLCNRLVQLPMSALFCKLYHARQLRVMLPDGRWLFSQERLDLLARRPKGVHEPADQRFLKWLERARSHNLLLVLWTHLEDIALQYLCGSLVRLLEARIMDWHLITQKPIAESFQGNGLLCYAKHADQKLYHSTTIVDILPMDEDECIV
ncbi:hypothetical protein CLAFUW4_12906 [Fulvia fulva]|uniref:Uncharacterized protein n=1 Tax=Passalora fulva TaxID=5499 RepID=A0A9Q8UV11_PASFU|nr:uncharacterized protein CLAFUR5_12772 [Fulvia fulva]KAK4612162.1 hypothetical protein CLAFUR4_12910 [Fulvia fulva]KAK4612716.1 hypothetical protein CLAFUR0_12916 [Fulvia fulva]UJO23468.1 hypothetical protein CLAFUR5_12772 [Fulvia fulva]WPV21458.1 hypothetical protein CLAFUW4_12906 [Fulvia fulva]WPV36248.1 hypothetical protein CLAFUW7_12913 [Fulvia fulva]